MERCSDCCSLARAGNAITGRALVVREDRRQVAVAEAAGVRRDRERLVDGLGAVQLGERDRLGELAPQLGRAGGRGGDQPPLGARPDRKERPLVGRCAARGLRSSAPAGRGG